MEPENIRVKVPWRPALGATLALLAVAVAGCENLVEKLARNACPAGLTARAAGDRSGIQWGKDKAKVEASITSVAVECLRVRNPAIETDKIKLNAYTGYSIAATARVKYEIHDSEFFETTTRFGNLEARAVFEATSASDVVLGSAYGTFRLVRGGSSGTVSATISGLGEDEIRRVTRVTVRWEYGRM